MNGEALTKLQKRRLSRYVCWACEQRLDRNICASVYGGPCSPEVMEKRRANCLAEYKPRSGRRALAETAGNEAK